MFVEEFVRGREAQAERRETCRDGVIETTENNRKQPKQPLPSTLYPASHPKSQMEVDSPPRTVTCSADRDMVKETATEFYMLLEVARAVAGDGAPAENSGNGSVREVMDAVAALRQPRSDAS